MSLARSLCHMMNDGPVGASVLLCGQISHAPFSIAPFTTVSHSCFHLPSLSFSCCPVIPTPTMHADHRIAQVGADPNATESEATQKYDTITLATEDMIAFAKDFIDLESTHPADQIKKRWVLHHFLATYLSVQYVKQAHELLDDITTVYGCEPSHRYYDPFTNYFAVRGKYVLSSQEDCKASYSTTFPFPSSLTPICFVAGRIDRFNDIIQRMINKGNE